jgi:hypothetical protein
MVYTALLYCANGVPAIAYNALTNPSCSLVWDWPFWIINIFYILIGVSIYIYQWLFDMIWKDILFRIRNPSYNFSLKNIMR